MLRSRSLLVASLAAAALLAHEEDASACSPPSYDPTVVSPKTGGSLPASAPGFVVTGDGKDTVQVFDSADHEIAGSLKTDRYYTYFAPSAALAPGAYKVRYESYESGPTEESAFNVTPAVAAPMKTGTLRVDSTDRTTEDVTTSSGSCTEEADLAVVELALDLDPSLVPYQDVIVWQTKVDGNHWYEAQRGPTNDANGWSYRRSLRLYTACDSTGTSGRDDGVSAGTHDVTIVPMLIGSTTTIAPATIRVAVTCDETNGTVTPVADLPPEPPVATADPHESEESTAGTASETGDPSAAKPQSTSGCAVSSSRTETSSLLVLAVASALVAARRRLRDSGRAA